MGRGDNKTKRGKISNGSFGVVRKRKKAILKAKRNQAAKAK